MPASPDHASSDLTPSPIIGRAAETAAIRHALRDSTLITVTGLPGAGKTETAIAAAARVRDEYRDGAALIRLDALQDETLLPHTIGAALRLPDLFNASPLAALTAQLRGKQLLLLLDTCEHLVGAVAQVTSVIGENCPEVSILATSREPLRVPGELTISVGPLPVPDAIRLVTEPVPDPAGLDKDGLRKLCDLLDCLPLALVMAARQLAAGTLDELLARLRDGYNFLSDPDAAVPRHQTLAAAIGWSHQLCAPAERLLWARASVFDGPFTVKDCQEVCATTHLTSEQIATAVTMLAERSLLLQVPHARPPRFVMPRTIRGYGAEMLLRLSEDEQMRRRYRNWRSGPRRDACWH